MKRKLLWYVRCSRSDLEDAVWDVIGIAKDEVAEFTNDELLYLLRIALGTD